MRHTLFTKLLVLYSYLLFQSCESFRVPSINFENEKYCDTPKPVLCVRSVPRYSKKGCLFVLNESDKNGASKPENSRRLFSFIKHPGIIWKTLRQRFGSQKVDQTINTASFTYAKNDISDSGTMENGKFPIQSPASSESMNVTIFDSSESMDRWVYSAPQVNLTGTWNIVISNDFLDEYDLYLRNLGQPFIVRSVAMNVIGRTTEETIQTEGGRSLLLRSINARGVWERTLITSGVRPVDECRNDTLNFSTPFFTTVRTADSEPVQAEAWWERNGTVHHSWLRGVTKYGGGDFESMRYLVDDGSTLVCESTFHPYNIQRDPARIQWRFSRRH